MKQNPVLHKKQLLEALEKSLGIVTPACKEVGISRNQFYVYYNTDPDFKKSVDDIQEITLDFAENQLLKKIKEGSERSILFYMKYRGRKRGYTESMDVTSDGKSIAEIKLIHIKKRDDIDEDGEEFRD
jgi:hypothetical protein